MEHKKFMDIQRLKEGFANGFRPGDEIVVQEKFDGSCASCRYLIFMISSQHARLSAKRRWKNLVYQNIL